MEDRHLESALQNVVVDGRAGDPQEEGQRLPVIEEVLDRTAQPGVGLDALLVQLFAQPAVKFVEERLAAFVMEAEALGRIEALLAGQGVVVKDVTQAFEDAPGLVRKARSDVDDLAPTVSLIRSSG